MKVLRVLGLVFGILLLLAGGGLLGAAALADRGQSAVRDQVVTQGFRGPVQATVIEAEPPEYTVRFTAENGREYRARAASTLSTPPRVGESVQVFYQADDPRSAVITELPTSALSSAASTLRISGIVALVIGGVLVIASILGFVLARRRPVPAPAGQPPPSPGYPQAPAPGYLQPPQPYAAPPQPGPTQPGPPQPGPPYPGPPYPGPGPQQPPQGPPPSDQR